MSNKVLLRIMYAVLACWAIGTGIWFGWQMTPTDQPGKEVVRNVVKPITRLPVVGDVIEKTGKLPVIKQLTGQGSDAASQPHDSSTSPDAPGQGGGSGGGQPSGNGAPAGITEPGGDGPSGSGGGYGESPTTTMVVQDGPSDLPSPTTSTTGGTPSPSSAAPTTTTTPSSEPEPSSSTVIPSPEPTEPTTPSPEEGTTP